MADDVIDDELVDDVLIDDDLDDEDREAMDAAADRLFADPSRTRIGLWGGTNSGKTTFLAALFASMLQAPDSWRMNADDVAAPGSFDFLAGRYDEFALQSKFPGNTISAEGRGYTYAFVLARDIELQVPVWGGWLGYRRVTQEHRIDLTVRDYPGSLMIGGKGNRYLDAISAFLARCDGIIYLFDPSATPVESLQSFNDLMLKLAGRMSRNGGSSRIPQPLAVCLTKYDDDVVFKRLRERGRIVLGGRDRPGLPSVTDPKAAFADFAHPNHVRMIENYFQTVEYFAMSAIGFYPRPDGGYDLDNCANVYMSIDGPRIRGQASPVGLLDPLIWLDGEIRRLKG